MHFYLRDKKANICISIDDFILKYGEGVVIELSIWISVNVKYWNTTQIGRWEMAKNWGRWEKEAKNWGRWEKWAKNLGRWDMSTPVSPPPDVSRQFNWALKQRKFYILKY